MQRKIPRPEHLWQKKLSNRSSVTKLDGSPRAFAAAAGRKCGKIMEGEFFMLPEDQ